MMLFITVLFFFSFKKREEPRKQFSMARFNKHIHICGVFLFPLFFRGFCVTRDVTQFVFATFGKFYLDYVCSCRMTRKGKNENVKILSK